MLEIPQEFKDSDFLRAQWLEITQEGAYIEKDIPLIKLLCLQYEIIDRCKGDLSTTGTLQVAYSDAFDNLKAIPQVNVLNQATNTALKITKELEKRLQDRNAQTRPKHTNNALTLIAGKYNRKSS